MGLGGRTGRRRTWMYLVAAWWAGMVTAEGQVSLDVPVWLTGGRWTLSQCLDQLSQQPGVKLSYSRAGLPGGLSFQPDWAGIPLRQALDTLLRQTDLTYRLLGDQVVLMKRETPAEEKAVLHGFLYDELSGERIAGAVLYEAVSGLGTYANEFGYFSLEMVPSRWHLVFSSLGYQSDTVLLEGKADTFLVRALRPAFLAEVIVHSVNRTGLLSQEKGRLDFNQRQIGRMTGLGGEPDIVRLAATLPGIQTGTDGFGGVSVRGGNVDQNLFLLDGVPVYNALHGIGLYSVFNSHAIRRATILKAHQPAQYGGRLSSVWDIQTKEGNDRSLKGQASVGISTAGLSLEGPLSQGKGSFFVSARRALFDLYSKPISRRLRQRNGADGLLSYYFHDLNLKGNLALRPRDRVFLSVYQGGDRFTDRYDQSRWFQDTLSQVLDRERVRWGNGIATLRWNRLISEKVFANTTLTYSRYRYESEDRIDVDLRTLDRGRIARDLLIQRYKSDIRDLACKVDLDYQPNPRHSVRTGVALTRHRFQPGIVSFDQATIVDSISTDTLGEWYKVPLSSMALDAYLQDDVQVGAGTVQLGLRWSGFFVGGSYHGSWQPRLYGQYPLPGELSLQASVNRLTQFLHLLTPSNIGLPKDLWVSATDRIPPQHAWQYSLGLSRRMGPSLELSLEGFYKDMQNLLNFRSNGFEEINAVNWQNHVSLGNGKAYGLELLLRLDAARLNGWLSYTRSNAYRQFGKDVNNGNRFPHRLDRRHSFHLQGLYRLRPNWDLTATFTFSTGTPFSFPVAQYALVQPPSGGAPTEIVSRPAVIDALNAERLPPYHRLDLGVTYRFETASWRHSLVLGVYNAYFRQNPLYYTIRDAFDEQGVLERKVIQVSVLPIFPSLRYVLDIE
ncbi:MAG: hypothetical protein RLY31_1987 [Bacteroidota bacterium]